MSQQFTENTSEGTYPSINDPSFRLSPANHFIHLAEALPNLVWMADHDGKVEYFNQHVSKFAGAVQQPDGSWQWQSMLHPDDLQSTETMWKNAVLNGGLYETEHRLQMLDGTYKWYLSRAYPLKDANDKTVKWYGTATDISNAAQTSQELLKTKNWLQMVLNGISDGFIVFDKAFRFEYIGQVDQERLAALGINANQLLGKVVWELLPESIVPLSVAMLKKVMEQRIPAVCEEKFGNKWYEMHAYPNADGGIVLISPDITERKNAADKVFYLDVLTHNIADAVVVTDHQFNITTWNKAAENIYGWTRQEVIGKPVKDILHTTYTDEQDDLTSYQQLSLNNNWQGQVMQSHKDGHQIHIHASIAIINDSDGNMRGFMAINKDITEQTKTAIVLRESEEKFRQMANLVPQIIWTARPDGKHDYFNSRWSQYIGKDATDVNLQWETLLHPNDVEICNQKWQTALQTGTTCQMEFRLQSPVDNTYRWFLGKALPVREKDRAITKWFGTFTDIHDQKTMSDKLEQIVHQRTEELTRSNDDLQQFAHVASHDLREPLRKIRMFTNRLEEEMGQQLSDKAKAYLEKINSAAIRMNSMIEGVLNYSTAQAADHSTETIQLHHILKNIENDLEVIIEQKKGTLIYDIFPGLEGVPVLIHQMFYNLVYNALKFSKENEPPVITITGSTVHGRQLQQQLDTATDQQYLAVQVSDNGIGFHENDANAIFNTFTRLNSKDLYEGTGLGLSLCRKIVQRHKGIIYATGAENQGATFHIILPLKQV